MYVHEKGWDGSLIILLLYVDDMLIAGQNKDTVQELKQQLSSAFSMKDLGPAEHILGMRIRRDRKDCLLYLSQERYLTKVLQRFQMSDAKPL
ncbi:reverse transcriptase domain-containing protein, partial [Escherichia coli]|uniref:reverse transcriptase domain-containing protein n=1 Tax=Escherichia coli TaxID=562 RepID=UPI00142DF46A